MRTAFRLKDHSGKDSPAKVRQRKDEADPPEECTKAARTRLEA